MRITQGSLKNTGPISDSWSGQWPRIDLRDSSYHDSHYLLQWHTASGVSAPLLHCSLVSSKNLWVFLQWFYRYHMISVIMRKLRLFHRRVVFAPSSTSKLNQNCIVAWLSTPRFWSRKLFVYKFISLYCFPKSLFETTVVWKSKYATFSSVQSYRRSYPYDPSGSKIFPLSIQEC